MTATLKELLGDPLYREFFRMQPPPIRNACAQPNWRVAGQRPDGRWRFFAGDFATYGAAANRIIRLLKEPRNSVDLVDYALVSRRVPYGRPAVKRLYVVKQGKKRLPRTKTLAWSPRDLGDLLATQWCPFCRRPQRFGFFRRHHALQSPTHNVVVRPIKRCVVCGTSEEYIRSISPIPPTIVRTEGTW